MNIYLIIISFVIVLILYNKYSLEAFNRCNDKSSNSNVEYNSCPQCGGRVVTSSVFADPNNLGGLSWVL